ncbi:MAG TPA: serine hydrolase [Actinopolymorphaceae bacterium]|jgi:beta-lactamase class A
MSGGQLELRSLEPVFAAVPGTVSVWCGRPDLDAASPTFSRYDEATHYAASTMKVAVMAAAYHAADAGRLDLDVDVPVHDEFVSAAGDSVTYRSTADYDNDPLPWQRLGGTVPLRWLVRRMIVRSSNLATNLVLERVGVDAVAAAWQAAGAHHATVTRGIQDQPAADQGHENLVTARDLAALLSAIFMGTRGRWSYASPAACREMLEILLAQEVTDDIAPGLPPGTTVAHKNGWVDGIRHSAAIVFPDDAPPFVLVTCVTSSLSDERARELLARVAAASWADRAKL